MFTIRDTQMCQLIFNRFDLYTSNSNVFNKTVQLAPTQKIVFLAYVHEIIHNLHFKIHEEYSKVFQTETQSQMEPPDYIFLCFVALCLHNRHVRCISKMSLPNECAMCQFRSSKEQKHLEQGKHKCSHKATKQVCTEKEAGSLTVIGSHCHHLFVQKSPKIRFTPSSFSGGGRSLRKSFKT